MNQRTLLGGAATAMLLLGVAAGPALAADSVSWNWDLTRTDTQTGVSTVTTNLFPTGLATLSGRQIRIGDSTAQADAGAGVTLPLNLDPADASVELGRVEADASAYGNLDTVGSEVSLTSNLGQYHVGAIDLASGATPSSVDPAALNGDRAYADKLIADRAAGLFTPSETSAMANAIDVAGATATANARAISNSSSIELAAAEPAPLGADLTAGVVSNGALASDLTQLSIGEANTFANAITQIDGYQGMAGVDRPLAAATATSIGNLGQTIVRFGALDTNP